MCDWVATTTVEPGCCYGNPDAAYSKHWVEACTGFCSVHGIMLDNGDGEALYHWEPKGDEYDRRRVRPARRRAAAADLCA